MGLKSFCGRYGILICSVIFSAGVLISTLSPSWIATELQIAGGLVVVENEFGPFYSRNRTCTIDASGAVSNFLNQNEEEDDSNCEEWTTHELKGDDCDGFTILITDPDTKDQVCRQHNTWRSLAMICNFIVVFTAVFVALATCTQCFTCGCCGGSFDYIASVAYWIEVVISIIAWSFCINVVRTIRDEDWDTFRSEQLDNIAETIETQELEDLMDGSFLWGFWLFVFSGTLMGAICATFAAWAAEGSILKCLTDCFKCVFCCKK